MSEAQQLDVSLTSMDWLSRLQVNKVGGNAFDLPTNPTFVKPTNQMTSSIVQSDSMHDSSIILGKLPENETTLKQETKLSSLETSNVPLLKTIPINSTPGTIINSGAILQIPSVHSVAQRAEPNRPVDLSAEYKGTDYNRRDGKPPYSYVTSLSIYPFNKEFKRTVILFLRLI
jgi:hypothetical protein